MPKLWSDTIETHRGQVRETILDATAAVVAEAGLLSATMSRIAARAGIGRATLYKYFPDVEAILHAWHERQIAGHLGHLAEVRDRPGEPLERLAALLEAFAVIAQQRVAHADPGPEVAMILHRGQHVDHARQHVSAMVRALLSEAAAGGVVRDDVPPDELAAYCLNAVSAAGELPSRAAIGRLVTVVLDGLRPGR